MRHMDEHLLKFDIFEGSEFSSQWESFIPKRPSMPEYNTNNEDDNDIKANDEYEA